MRRDPAVDDADAGPAAQSLASGEGAGEREQLASSGLIDMIEVGLEGRCDGAQALQALAGREIARHRERDASKTELRVAEIIRPKLIADGMFLVGIDIVGDKILEVNVFSPGNLKSCSTLAGVDFSETIVDCVERKVEIRNEYGNAFDNRHLAML